MPLEIFSRVRMRHAHGEPSSEHRVFGRSREAAKPGRQTLPPNTWTRETVSGLILENNAAPQFVNVRKSTSWKALISG